MGLLSVEVEEIDGNLDHVAFFNHVFTGKRSRAERNGISSGMKNCGMRKGCLPIQTWDSASTAASDWNSKVLKEMPWVMRGRWGGM